MGKPLAVIAALAVVYLLLLGGCGAAGGSDSTAGAPSVAREPLVDTAILAPSFAVFRGARDEADRVQGNLPPGMIPALGLELAASRYSRQVTGNPAWLIPGRSLVCLYTDDEVIGSCWKPEIIKEGRAMAATLCGPGLGAGRVAIYGIVPDGVRAVTIQRSSAPSFTVPVEGNVIVARTSSKPPLPLSVSWAEGGRRVVRSSGIPAQVAREGC